MGCISSTQEDLGADVVPNVEPAGNDDIMRHEEPVHHNIQSNHDHNNNNNNQVRNDSVSQNSSASAPMAVDDTVHSERVVVSNNIVNASNAESAECLQPRNWNTDDVISYICTIDNGKFCESQYDMFKAGLLSMGVTGSQISTLCYDANILKDMGLHNDMDVALIQNAFVQLETNYGKQAPAASANGVNAPKQISVSLASIGDNQNQKEEDDDFFPLDWTFPVEPAERLKNPHYVNQRLLITDKYLHSTPATCIYVENNWIVIRYDDESQKKQDENTKHVQMMKPLEEQKFEYKEKPPSLKPMKRISELAMTRIDSSTSELVSPMNYSKVYNHMEKLHVIKESSRIQKVTYAQAAAAASTESGKGSETPPDTDTIFEREYVGMSAAFSSCSLSVGDVIVPDCYCDPITYEIMSNPVTTKQGRTYDEAIILQHLEEYGTDPVTQQPMSKDDLKPNLPLKKAIQRWLKRNPQTTTAC